jgi:hypothetical protein
VITLQSRIDLDDVTAREVTDFLLNPRDDAYRAWWPGTHREFHVVRAARGGDHVGDVVWMDEMVGPRRVAMTAEVEEALPGERVVWRLRKFGLRLPIRVMVTTRSDDAGVTVYHTITAGWRGPGRLVDSLWRGYFSPSFARAMDEHARTEFPLLRELLRPDAGTSSTARPPVDDAHPRSRS